MKREVIYWLAQALRKAGFSFKEDQDPRVREMRDAIFTYFEIPPYFCNDDLIKASDEPMSLVQKVYA